jgi:lysozyme family protein
MKSDLDLNAALVERLIAREGGFVNHPHDSGGPTKYGITARTLAVWRRQMKGHVPGTKAEAAEAVRTLTKREAQAIYRRLFLERYNLDKIHVEHLREHVLDAVVLHPARTAIRWLQRAVGVKPDGIVGPVTLSAVNTSDDEELSVAFFKRRMAYIARIVARDPRQARFLRGWTGRATSFI